MRGGGRASASGSGGSKRGELAAIAVVAGVLCLVGPPFLYFTVGPHLSDLSQGIPGSVSGIAQVEGGRRGSPLLILHREDGRRTIFRCSLDVRDRKCFRTIRQAGLRDGDAANVVYLKTSGAMGDQPIVLAVRAHDQVLIDCPTSLDRLGLRTSETIRRYCTSWGD